MRQAVTLLLVAAIIGLPLGVAHTKVTIALAGMAGFFAVVGVLISSAPSLTTGVMVSLMEALVAFLQGGQPPHVWLALLLGVGIYVLLDISAFCTGLHGAAVETSVWRMKAMHWGGFSLLFGLVALMLGLIAATLARPLAHPLLGQILTVLAAVIAVGAVLGILRVWHRGANDVFDRP